jgi:hypothetical protein
VRFGAACVHRCGVADAIVGADVVVAGESFPTVEAVSGPYGPASGFDGWFASLERGREREPSGGRVRPGTMAAAAEVAGESPGTCRPAGSPVWRLFIPAGTEPVFRL